MNAPHTNSSVFVDMLNLAIRRGSAEDAETLLACARVQLPRKPELDVFEALIAMRRGRRDEAMRVLRNLDDAMPQSGTAKGFLAYCQFLSGDPAWRDTAQSVLDSPHSSPRAVEMIHMLFDPPVQEAASEVPATAESSSDMVSAYMRA